MLFRALALLSHGRTHKTSGLGLALCLPLLLTLPGAASAGGGPFVAEARVSAKPVHGVVKLKDWNADRQEGVIRFQKKLYLLRLEDKCRIRVDRMVLGGRWDVLDRFGAQHGREVWCFARRNMYAEAIFQTKGIIKPRLVLATGYALEPLPKGRVTVRGAHGALGWLQGTVDDWTGGGGRARIEGKLFDLSLLARERVLVATQGDRRLLRKGKTIHLDGFTNGSTASIRRSGRLVQGSPLRGHLTNQR